MFDEVILNDLEEIYSRRNYWSRFDNSTVMITGATGMLASYLLYYFMFLHERKRLNVKLVLIVRSREKVMKLIKENKDYIAIIVSDMSSSIEYDGEVNYIIHAASLASPQFYSTIPVDVLKPNVLGTFYLLEFARRKMINSFLLFSSGDIYGKVDNIDIIRETDYGCMDTLSIHNCYSESKRMAETICYSYLHQYGIPVKIARIWHTYAPTMDVKNDPRVFSAFVNNVIEGEDIVMRSDGTGMRAFCYISDAIDAYIKIMLDGDEGNAYNVCNETQFISIMDLANIMCKLRPEKNIRVINDKRKENDQYVENIHLKGVSAYPSSDKLRKLGWNPYISVLEGFDRVLKYYGC